MIKRTWMLFLLGTALRASAAPTLIAAYNENASWSGGAYWPYSVGWLWEAPQNFQLTRIETKFFATNKIVGIEVYNGLPSAGGQLLASNSYNEVAETWGGADLGPVPLIAGEDYFIGFTNVEFLGVSFTEDAGATRFSSDGQIHYDSDSSFPPSYQLSYFGQANAILRIYGIVPEPSSGVAAMCGAAALIGAGRRRSSRFLIGLASGATP